MTTPFPFQAGSVLPAQSLNDITNLPINDQTASYSLVVGDAGKRVVMNVATANTVTVDDDIFTTGDTIFVANKGEGPVTLTEGSGVTINSASGLVLVEHQSGQLVALSASSFLFVLSAGPAPAVPPGGLTFITGATFTAAASVSLPAATFSATFDNYQFMFDIADSSTDIALAMRFRIGGADNTTGNYNNGFTGLDNIGTTQTKVVNGGSSFALSDISTGVDRQIINLTIANPFGAHKTEISGFVGRQASALGGFAVMSGGGIFNATTSFDSLTIICSTGTITGIFRVYGYANS